MHSLDLVRCRTCVRYDIGKNCIRNEAISNVKYYTYQAYFPLSSAVRKYAYVSKKQISSIHIHITLNQQYIDRLLSIAY